MYQKLLLGAKFITLLIILIHGSALSGTLCGLVLNNINHNRLPGVEVSVFQIDSTLAGIDTTGQNGVYYLTLDDGEYFAVYSKENYADTTVTDIIITSGGTVIINLTLRFKPNCDYVPGDVNDDGVCNGFDVTYLIAWMNGGPPPPYECECAPDWIWWPALDFNGSCSFNGLDLSYIMAYFRFGLLEIMPCGDCPPVE